LPVFDSTSINADGPDKKTSITSGRPYKIVEVENPDQIVPLEVKNGYSQVTEMTNLPTNGIFFSLIYFMLFFCNHTHQ
jgi:hypothetical protein